MLAIFIKLIVLFRPCIFYRDIFHKTIMGCHGRLIHKQELLTFGNVVGINIVNVMSFNFADCQN